MRWYHISFTSFLLLFCSFFWEDDEREIKALHQMAESAMRDSDFSSAVEAYQTLLKRVDTKEGKKNSVTWSTYIDMVMRLAEAYAATDRMSEGVRVLTELLNKNPPATFAPRIKLYRARLTSQESRPQEAFLEMQSVIEMDSQHDWSREELSFYHALCYALDAQYDDSLRKAKRLTATGFHGEAIQIYEEVLEAIQAGYFPKARQTEMLEKKLRYLLVETNYQMKNYEKSLIYSNASLDAKNAIDREIIYLQALCYKEQAEYEKAVRSFRSYAEAGGEHVDQALFEIGYHYYRGGNWEEAKKYFESLQKPTGKKPKPTVVAAIYLAKMLIQEERYREVDPLLSPLALLLPKNDPLGLEINYLRGKAAYALDDFVAASQFFDAALPPRGSGEWRFAALYQLGWSYLRLCDDPKKSPEERADFFAKSEATFQRLLTTKEGEAATLALGRLYLVQGGENSRKRMEALFEGKDFSLPGSHEALLLRAESQESYDKREALFQEACSPRFEVCSTYPKGWYLRGINHFQKGLDMPSRGEEYFTLATKSFEEAFFRYKEIDPKAAARILKLEAKADFYRNSPSTSLAYLEELLEQYNESADEKQETIYLRGMIASSLSDFALAKECLKQVVTLYPKGRFADDALFVLGTLYFQEEDFEIAEQTFLQLAEKYPDSSFAGDGWYFAAQAAEKLGKDAERTKQLRRQVYENYPSSQFAAEAYFHQYPYTSYLEGDEEALSHLMPFPQMFPRSPLVVAVNYLMGRSASSFEKKEWRFREAIRTFHSCQIFDPSAITFLYHARLELALLYKEHGEPVQAHHLLDLLLDELKNPYHPLASKLEEPFPFFERAQYALAEVYLDLQDQGKAQEALGLLLDRYRDRGERNSFYLASAWRESGKIALACHDHQTALGCFELAQDAGHLSFSEGQFLDLLLLKSACYRARSDYDMAMRLLSKVINADVASPLRLRAMFERAELYELQERPELAVRQLESIAKMGGEWALAAEKKLKERYGL